MIYFLCFMTAMGLVGCIVAAVRGKHELSVRLSWQSIVMFTITAIYSVLSSPIANCFYF